MPLLVFSVDLTNVNDVNSSDGRALDSHSRGRGIDTSHLHLFFLHAFDSHSRGLLDPLFFFRRHIFLSFCFVDDN